MTPAILLNPFFTAITQSTQRTATFYMFQYSPESYPPAPAPVANTLLQYTVHTPPSLASTALAAVPSPTAALAAYVPSPLRELALLNMVNVGGLPLFVPCVDMKTASFRTAGLTPGAYMTIVQDVAEMEDYLGLPAMIFDTGNSYHVYFEGLLTQSAHETWLGWLRDLAESAQSDIRSPQIDYTWVRNTIDRRVATLRWTHTTRSKQQIKHLSLIHI